MPESVNSALASWRTTALGLAVLIAAAAEALAYAMGAEGIPPAHLPDWLRMVVEIAMGSGLVAARDNVVSSEKAGAE